MNAQDGEVMSRAEVTDRDRGDFQRWLRKTWKRYQATRGMRDRPDGQLADHARITSASVTIGKDVRETVTLALAALVVHANAEDDPLTYLRAWAGSVEEVVEGTVERLNSEGDSLRQFAVYGLWCEDDGCRRFIRPIAVKLSRASGSLFVSSVCATCQSVTVLWADAGGLWVRSAPELKGRNHPMHPQKLHTWVQQSQPPTNREPKLIAP